MLPQSPATKAASEVHETPPESGISNCSDPERAYEELLGGMGREVFHRLERVGITSLLEGCTELVHEVRFGAHQGTLTNYAVNGLAFSLPASVSLSQDQVLEYIEVIVGDETVYTGAAMVRYTQLHAATRLVGVALLDGILDPDRILTAKSRVAARSTMVAVADACHADIHPEYKQALADAVFLMNSYRRLLTDQERALGKSTVGEARARGEREALDAAETGFRAQYDELRLVFNRRTADLAPRLRETYKRYTESMLHPCVLCAPAAHHCYIKPLGYPGDYVLMSHLYSDERRGDTLYAKLIHQVVVREEPLAAAVRQRKDFMLSLIRQVAMTPRASADRARIMSLGCGPAQEILEYVQDRESPEIGLTLVDQDQRSLAHVNWTLSKLLVPRRAPTPAQYLYIGFKQLLARNEVLEAIRDQDLIYTAGLFDYLSPRIAQRLALRLFHKLRPGGTLAIGNFGRPSGAAWSLDYWMDWPLIYRTREDMLDIARNIGDSGSKAVKTDASGYTNILIIHKH